MEVKSFQPLLKSNQTIFLQSQFQLTWQIWKLYFSDKLSDSIFIQLKISST